MFVLLCDSQCQIEHMVYYDWFIGLFNCVLLVDCLCLVLVQVDCVGFVFGVCYFDFDGFKLINDEWGYDVGDVFLYQVGQCLFEYVWVVDMVVCIGGDEFVVLVCGVYIEVELVEVVQCLFDVVVLLFCFNDWVMVSLIMSVGVVIWL